jgi:hypothetical protein
MPDEHPVIKMVFGADEAGFGINQSFKLIFRVALDIPFFGIFYTIALIIQQNQCYFHLFCDAIGFILAARTLSLSSI